MKINNKNNQGIKKVSDIYKKYKNIDVWNVIPIFSYVLQKAFTCSLFAFN